MSRTSFGVVFALFYAVKRELAESRTAFMLDEVVPIRIERNGLVIMRSGEPGEPVEVTMSPLIRYYNRRVEFEVIAGTTIRTLRSFDIFEDLVRTAIMRVVRGASFSRSVDFLEYVEAVPSQLFVEGAGMVRVSTIGLDVHYAVPDADVH